MGPPRCLAAVLVVALAPACERHAVEIEAPVTGRALTRAERREMQRVADGAFAEARGLLTGLPTKLTLIVRWGKDVIPETGETGAAAFPGNVGWTVDPDRDLEAVIRTQLRLTLLHELHHLARASHVTSRSLVDRVVTEGLATAFERDVGKAAPPWSEPPPEAWTREILALPDTADVQTWLYRHPDGRRWVGVRVGTQIVDRATRASGRSPAALVNATTDEVLRAAGAR